MSDPGDDPNQKMLRSSPFELARRQESRELREAARASSENYGFELRLDVSACVRVESAPHSQDIQIVVEMSARDRDAAPGAPAKVVRLATRQVVPRYMWERFPQYRADEVRRACRQALMHELDESFYVNGVRVFDPHKGEGTDGNGAPV